MVNKLTGLVITSKVLWMNKKFQKITHNFLFKTHKFTWKNMPESLKFLGRFETLTWNLASAFSAVNKLNSWVKKSFVDSSPNIFSGWCKHRKLNSFQKITAINCQIHIKSIISRPRIKWILPCWLFTSTITRTDKFNVTGVTHHR